MTRKSVSIDRGISVEHTAKRKTCTLDSFNRFATLKFVSNHQETKDASPDENGHTATNHIKPLPIKPGVSTCSEAVTEGKKTFIFSTSMTRSIRINEFNEFYEEGTAQFYKFHGAKVRHIKHYVTAHLAEGRPDSVIILAGGNDLPTHKNNPTSVLDIANHIIDTGMICAGYNAKVYISSVLPRQQAYMQTRRK